MGALRGHSLSKCKLGLPGPFVLWVYTLVILNQCFYVQPNALPKAMSVGPSTQGLMDLQIHGHSHETQCLLHRCQSKRWTHRSSRTWRLRQREGRPPISHRLVGKCQALLLTSNDSAFYDALCYFPLFL